MTRTGRDSLELRELVGLVWTGGFLKRTINSGFRFFFSGSGAHVSVGRWSDGSISRPSSPMIGVGSRLVSFSFRRAASIACAGVSYGRAESVVREDRDALGFRSSYESGEKGIRGAGRSSVSTLAAGCGLTDFRRGTTRESECAEPPLLLTRLLLIDPRSSAGGTGSAGVGDNSG